MTSEVPKSCPGVESSNAGKGSMCAGCPNQGVCSSGTVKSGPDEDMIEICGKMNDRIKNILLILSGKGGVGKSTISNLISRSLASDDSVSVGLLDIDICGPSIPRAMGLLNESVHSSQSGWSPVFVQDNLEVMSCGFLLGSEDDAVIWRGPKKNGLIRQFLKDVDWSNLDYLVIDTPPGTSDEHLSITSYLKLAQCLRGAVIVTTPQEVSLIDVRKQIDFCQRIGLRILGIVENMSGFICPKCHKDSVIFKKSLDSVEKLCQEMRIRHLGQLPLDPMIGKSCDEGLNIFELFPESSSVDCLKIITNNLLHVLSNSDNTAIHDNYSGDDDTVTHGNNEDDIKVNNVKIQEQNNQGDTRIQRDVR